jgi:5-methyltetrahydropteroyltriglutamate--homocysteine methyltransferase
MSLETAREHGLDLPLLPLTSVGSLPKPPELKEARRQEKDGEITKDELDDMAREKTKFWIDKQEEIGLDVLVDGEQYRGDMATYFANNLEGFEIGGLVRSYGNRYYRKPIVNDEIRFQEPMTVDWWRFAQDQTDKPVKGILTGPYTMMDWSFNEHYSSRADTARALADALQKEAQALIDAGCKIVQIDEPAGSVREEEIPLLIEVMERMTEGLDAYFVTHMCYGNFENIYPEMLDLAVDNIDLELSNSELDMLDVFEENPFTKDLSFGAVDVHDHEIEDADVVEDRIESTLNVIPDDQVWVDPDCGLKTRTVDEAIGKLEVIAEATKSLRGAVA